MLDLPLNVQCSAKSSSCCCQHICVSVASSIAKVEPSIIFASSDPCSDAMKCMGKGGIEFSVAGGVTCVSKTQSLRDPIAAGVIELAFADGPPSTIVDHGFVKLLCLDPTAAIAELRHHFSYMLERTNLAECVSQLCYFQHQVISYFAICNKANEVSLDEAGCGQHHRDWFVSLCRSVALQENPQLQQPGAGGTDPSNPSVAAGLCLPRNDSFVTDKCEPLPAEGRSTLYQSGEQALRSIASAVNKSLANQIMEFHLKECRDDSSGAPATGDACPTIDNPSHDVAKLPAENKRLKRTSCINMVSFNGNSWSTIKSFMTSTSANIVCCQEHKLVTDNDLIEAKLWCRTHGWQSFFSCGSTTKKGGKSGGTGVLVRTHIQAWIPGEFGDAKGTFWPYRSASVMVHAGGLGVVCISSCYFFTNSTAKEKIHESNMRFIAALGQFIRRVDVPVIVASDWQMTPNVLQSSPLLSELRLTAIHDSSGLGTCVTRGGASVSNIDFFIVSTHLADLVKSCYVCPHSPPRPHRPVHVDFVVKAKCVRVRAVREPKSIPTDPPFGPLPLPACWQDTSTAVAASLKDFHPKGVDGFYSSPAGCDSLQIAQRLQEALVLWSAQAEVRLVEHYWCMQHTSPEERFGVQGHRGQFDQHASCR